MAVRFDAATDRVSYTGTTDPPDISTGVTVTFWAYLSVDQNAFSTLLRFWSSSFGTVVTITTNAGGEVPVAVSPGNTGGVVSGETMAVGQWSKVGFTCTGTTGNLYVADTGATDVSSGTVDSSGLTDGFTVGGRDPGDSSEAFNGRIAQLRVFSVVLSQTQVEAEWDSPTAVETGSLWADYPLSTASDLTDHSGNARHLSAGTTAVTTEDDPPNGAEAVDGTLLGQGGGTGALTGTRRVNGTLTGSAAGSGALSGKRVVHGTAAGLGGGTGALSGMSTSPGEVAGTGAGAGGGAGALTGKRVVHGVLSRSGGGTGVIAGTVTTQVWRLIVPPIVERWPVPGTNNALSTTLTREATVFGDENGLFTTELGSPSEGTDEYGAIPFGTKYIWLGGHVNTTDDPAVKDLWLAHGFGADNV